MVFRGFRFLLAVLALLVTPPAGLAGPPTPEEVWAWIVAERERAMSRDFDQPMKIDYIAEYHSGLSVRDLQAIREKVARFPDHPDRHLLHAADSDAKNGPTVVHATLWVGSPALYRHQWDFADPSSTFPFRDYGALGDDAWSLTNRFLIIQNRLGDAPPGEQPASHSGTVISDRRVMLFGAMLANPGASLDPKTYRFDGREWSVEAAHENGDRSRIRGRWDAALKRGFTLRADAVVSRPESPGMLDLSSEEWVHAPDVGAWFSKHTEQDFGNTRQVFKVSSVEPLSREDLEAVARPPTSSSDVLRGRLSLASVREYRPAGTRLLGGSGTAPIGSVSGRWLPALASVAAVSVVIWVVWLKVRQS